MTTDIENNPSRGKQTGHRTAVTTSVHVRGLLLPLRFLRRIKSTGERQVEILEIGCNCAQQFSLIDRRKASHFCEFSCWRRIK